MFFVLPECSVGRVPACESGPGPARLEETIYQCGLAKCHKKEQEQERALLPSLLSGSCNWTGVKKQTEEDCDELIYLFWRAMFKIPDGTPKIGLIAETSTLRTKWRIWKEKLMLVRRLQKMESSVLARQVYERQLQLGLPGLAREVKDICDSLKIPDINYFNVRKEKIEEYIFYNHYQDMKELMEKSKKMDKIRHEDFTKEQKYLNYRSIDSARTQMRVRLEMMETFKDNFRTKYRTLGRGEEDRDPGLLCDDCGQSRDSQSHCVLCPAWQEARDRLDLTCIEDLVVYFQRVLKGREEKKDKQRKEKQNMERERKEQERTRPN